jgi:hypothetical protein
LTGSFAKIQISNLNPDFWFWIALNASPPEITK